MKFYFFSIPPAEGQTTSSSRKESAPRLAPCTPPVWGAHPRRPAPPSTRPLGERPAVRTSAPHLPHPPPLSPHIMPKRPACAHANALQRLPYADCRFRGSVRLARRTVPAAPHPPPTARIGRAPRRPHSRTSPAAPAAPKHAHYAETSSLRPRKRTPAPALC
jgi:hypothetical protein